MRVKRHLLSAAVGAGLVWFSDPRQGARRRERARAALDRGTAVARRTVASVTGQPASGDHMPTSPPTMSDVIAAAKGSGFDGDFMADGRQLRCSACTTVSEPSLVPREWVHRLEGMSDPDELLTISALVCPVCGSKGLLVMPYGPAADELEADIARQLQTPRHADMAPLDALRVAV